MAYLGGLPSLRRQHLLSEFTGLKQACPEGVFLSLTPGDPTLWSAVLFVRDGPYAPAVMRFQMSFPDTYPKMPPLILFSTDIFHPLITPLTTYIYTADVQDDDTVSANEQERLPPGGFSLRHGFPWWFGNRKQTTSVSKSVGGEQMSSAESTSTGTQPGSSIVSPTPSHANATNPSSCFETGNPNISIYSVLQYIRSSFDTPEVLDSVPLAAAGNHGAWHAWRTHRQRQGKLADNKPKALVTGTDSSTAKAPAEKMEEPTTPRSTGSRRPGEWNWDGVWEDRVRKGIAASLSEPVLYGGSVVPDEMIRFLPMEDADVESVKDNLLRTLGSAS